MLKNYGRKAIVTFVCTWLHCEKRQITLIVSHCTQGFQNSGLKGQDREIYFLTARLHQLYLSITYCSRAPDFLLDHVMEPQSTDILRNWVLTSPVTIYLPSGEKETVVMVFLWQSGRKYLDNLDKVYASCYLRDFLSVWSPIAYDECWASQHYNIYSTSGMSLGQDCLFGQPVADRVVCWETSLVKQRIFTAVP